MHLLKKHKVEIITAIVALTISGTCLVWIELGKPNWGVLGYIIPERAIRHKDTGAVLRKGRTKRQAVESLLNRLYGRRRQENPGWAPEPGRGPRNGGYDTDDLDRWIARRESLAGADLHGVNFANADLRWLHLRDADCDGATFHHAQIIDAKMEGATFRGADFDGAELGKSDFSRADLSGAKLTRVDLSGTVLRDAVLASSDISGSFFVEADCRGVDFGGVTFDGRTNFRGAQLQGARNMSSELRDHAVSTGGILETVPPDE